ncbi:hypothetical protein [Haloarchaeobius sp. DFWS5]|uniref:hypothetical protein n=1 Tax=Haloarchaeobius sp. DFWS5 TaxID=3446114 RepID=UPI003EB8ADB7
MSTGCVFPSSVSRLRPRAGRPRCRDSEPHPHTREHDAGMAVDLAFALAWETLVSLLFEVLQGPS